MRCYAWVCITYVCVCVCVCTSGSHLQRVFALVVVSASPSDVVAADVALILQ